jgi:hypothetical protein
LVMLVEETLELCLQSLLAVKIKTLITIMLRA